MDKLKIGIVGDTGMVGQEIQKILANHPGVEIIFRQNSKRTEGNVAPTNLVFLATKDEESMRYAPDLINMGKRVIDMSGAFRLRRQEFEKWYSMEHTASKLLPTTVYGLPGLGPLQREKIAGAQLVANPGCYPTSVILAIQPITAGLIHEASVVSTSGMSGARKEIAVTSNERSYNYGRRHKHVPEMERYTGFKIDFTPIILESVERGINTNIRVKLWGECRDMAEGTVVEQITAHINSFYCEEDMVTAVIDTAEKCWGTRDVNGTHKAIIKVRVDEGYAYISSMIDNLWKGAASQAVENMNIMFGLPRLQGIV